MERDVVSSAAMELRQLLQPVARLALLKQAMDKHLMAAKLPIANPLTAANPLTVASQLIAANLLIHSQLTRKAHLFLLVVAALTRFQRPVREAELHLVVVQRQSSAVVVLAHARSV